MIGRGALLLYRVLAYLAFLTSFSALIVATTDLGFGLVPSIDRAPTLPTALAIVIDTGLVFLFAVQHTIMARAPFKRALARILPPPAERSTFVLASSLCVAAIAFAWAPVAPDLWDLYGLPASILTVIAGAGWLLAGASTFAFDHCELFGLRAPGNAAPSFAIPLLYRLVRHPMMLGMLLGFWSAPHMTVGHALFAAILTAYVIVGVRYEERDLLRVFGDDYARYQSTVPSLLPWPRPSRHERT